MSGLYILAKPAPNWTPQFMPDSSYFFSSCRIAATFSKTKKVAATRHKLPPSVLQCPPVTDPLTYRDSGVDIDAGNEAVRRIKRIVSARPRRVAGGKDVAGSAASRRSSGRISTASKIRS